jgi:hypothetical protein
MAKSLDTYMACSTREKIQVLTVFWRSNDHSPLRLVQAAVQYGRYAIALFAVIVVEFVILTVLLFSRSSSWAWLCAAGAVAAAWATMRGIERLAQLRRALTAFGSAA